MTTIHKNGRDRHFHHEDGTHRTTSISTRGSDIAQYESGLRKHLDHHRQIDDYSKEGV